VPEVHKPAQPEPKKALRTQQKGSHFLWIYKNIYGANIFYFLTWALGIIFRLPQSVNRKQQFFPKSVKKEKVRPNIRKN
jgi:hypothetical protein